MMQLSNDSFEVDWKFNAEDLLFGAEKIVGKLPIKYIGEEEVNGDWEDVKFEYVKSGGDNHSFKLVSK